ncbi:MAG: membrane dipeptidase [Bacteroidaceae bacterium]|nr:membrane dipeptidase [Bacteroidaceae bacterium]
MIEQYSLARESRRYDDALSEHIMRQSSRPVIGITTNLGDKGAELACAYYESIRHAGGMPLLLPPTENVEEVIEQLEQIDGLLLTGGADLNPLWLGEQPIPQLHGIKPGRDLFELQLCRLAHQRNIPVMGICRGCQVLAAALGGTVAQDIAACRTEEDADKTLLKHSQDAPRSCATHTIHLADTAGVLDERFEGYAVNSFHHQAVLTAGPLMHVAALAPDGVVEAVEGNVGESFLLGVQWHPECLTGSELSAHLFSRFVEAASLYCRALELHAAILTLDSHCDTPMTFHAMTEQADDPAFRPDLLHRNPHCLVDAVKAAEGHLDEVFMVSYIPQGPRTAEGYADARRQVETTRQQLDDALREGLGPLFVHFGIENGYAIGKDLGLLAHYRDLGAEYITLCHNGHNDICDSARPRKDEHDEEWGGLSPFGREVVHEMNRLGLLIDVSHASAKTVADVLTESSKPIAATHACCRALCDHPRNLTDEQLRAIAAQGGVVQCTMYPYFLAADGNATIDTFMQHLLHMIEVCGIEHVGIGSDFDGDGGVPGLHDASDMLHITERLLQAGFSDNDICRIWGDNFRRVLAECQN